MADAVGSGPCNEGAIATPGHTLVRRARTRRSYSDAWLAVSGLLAGLLALPLAQNAWHGPEVAAVLAVSATALFAGQRWAIALIVIGDLFLLPTVWPRAFLSGDLASRSVALMTLAVMVPGALAMRRAATVLVVMSGQRRTQQTCRRVHGALVGLAVLVAALPLL